MIQLQNPRLILLINRKMQQDGKVHATFDDQRTLGTELGTNESNHRHARVQVPASYR